MLRTAKAAIALLFISQFSAVQITINEGVELEVEQGAEFDCVIEIRDNPHEVRSLTISCRRKLFL
jgi:hypothetical protein